MFLLVLSLGLTTMDLMGVIWFIVSFHPMCVEDGGEFSERFFRYGIGMFRRRIERIQETLCSIMHLTESGINIHARSGNFIVFLFSP